MSQREQLRAANRRTVFVVLLHENEEVVFFLKERIAVKVGLWLLSVEVSRLYDRFVAISERLNTIRCKGHWKSRRLVWPGHILVLLITAKVH